jgi:hypothetical protein
MPRLRLKDIAISRLPGVIGKCAGDSASIASFVNSAQRRLLMCKEAGEESWWGTWAEVQFSGISSRTPYITTPVEVARIEKLDICGLPTPVYNQFYEYLDFGNGRMPKMCNDSRWNWWSPEAYTRNNAITFAEPTVSQFYLAAYSTNSDDVASSRRILFQGLDANGMKIYSQDGSRGEYVTLASPFAQTNNLFTTITGIQKDVTVGEVQIFQVDSAGNQTQISVMQPSETVAGYRRYYLHSLPPNCCAIPGAPVNLTATAIVKLELIPAVLESDYLLIQNLEALIEECIAVRMSEMDSESSQKLAMIHHVNAVRLLNAEIGHYLGTQEPAVNFAPFGSARLERQSIGLLL